jgi:hypothetical protein
MARYSPSLPAEMLEPYENAVIAPDALTMSDDNALLEARVHTLLRRSGKVPDWDAVWELIEETQAALGEDEENPALTKHLAKLARLAGGGAADDRLWRQIERVIQGRRRLAEAEQKRILSSQTLVSRRELITVAVAIGESVQAHAKHHPEIVRGIQGDLQRIFGAGFGGTSGGGSDDRALKLPIAARSGADPFIGAAYRA